MYSPYAHEVQCDMTLSGQDFLSIPEEMPGRVNTDDFIFFEGINNLPESQRQHYSVIISSNDTAGSTFRKLGPLKSYIKLPFVKLDAYGTVGILHNYDENQPSFWSRLNRGSTYTIPSVGNKPGRYVLKRHGVLTSAVSDGHLATHYAPRSYSKIDDYN